MTEEIKKENAKPETKKGVPVIFKTILGLIFLALGIWAVLKWKTNIIFMVKGCIGLFLLLIGAVTLAVAKD